MSDDHTLIEQARPARTGREGRPGRNHPGEIGEDYRLQDQKQDRKFQDRMLLALSRRQERMPQAEKPRTHDSVPRRPFATGLVLTASNLEN